MKTKEIYEEIKSLVMLLQKKVRSGEESKPKIPSEIVEYTKGQLYEAGYILELVERIIFKD